MYVGLGVRRLRRGVGAIGGDSIGGGATGVAMMGIAEGIIVSIGGSVTICDGAVVMCSVYGIVGIASTLGSAAVVTLFGMEGWEGMLRNMS